MNVFIIDHDGYYLSTVYTDIFGPQIPNSVYVEPPEVPDGLSLRWLNGEWTLVEKQENNTQNPYVEIPQEVTMAQCRLALFDKHDIETDDEFYGLTDILPEEMRVRARLELRTRPTVRYDNPLVIAFCEARGWDRDELFVYADTL